MTEKTIVDRAIFTGSKVYGMAVWDLVGTPKDQSNLTITFDDEQTITVDDIKVAQFVHLLLDNPQIRDVINTIGKKGVLVLGRFTERKYVLDKIREKLRQLEYVPLVFDFERPTDRDFTETVKVLAGMSLFIIADITKPKSVPLELQATVPDYMIPFVPLQQKGEDPFAMFKDLQNKYTWVLPVVRYSTVETLLDVFEELVKEPALAKRLELMSQKVKEVVTVDADEVRKSKLQD